MKIVMVKLNFSFKNTIRFYYGCEPRDLQKITCGPVYKKVEDPWRKKMRLFPYFSTGLFQNTEFATSTEAVRCGRRILGARTTLADVLSDGVRALLCRIFLFIFCSVQRCKIYLRILYRPSSNSRSSRPVGTVIKAARAKFSRRGGARNKNTITINVDIVQNYCRFYYTTLILIQ